MNFNLKDYMEKNKDKLKKYGYIGILVLILIILYIVIIGPYFKFKDNEKKFKNYVLTYCEEKSNCMPKEGNYKGYTLEKAYEEAMIKETLYVPNSNKMCDTENSWVRIFNENGTYKTYTYLKCGIFSSLIDHEGPKITLKGDEEVFVDLNGTYEDAGVSKVRDNKDGDISVSEVKLNGSVDTTKVGDYTITYYTLDKLKNKGTVTRKVHVVSTLIEAIKNDTDESNRYKGGSANNLLLFSGMLWRIVGINEDNTIKLVLEDGIAALPFGSGGYDESNVVKYLNDVFLSQIHDYGKYLKADSTFCIDQVADKTKPTCNELSKPNYVGLLSISDAIGSMHGELTYLNNNVATWLSNKGPIRQYAYRNGIFLDEYVDVYASVRPVVNLKSEGLHIKGGNGSSKTPYKLADYEYGKAGEKLNTRLIGENVEYSGVRFAITGFDKNKNIILTSSGPYTTAAGGEIIVNYSDSDPFKILDNTKEGNLGYQLENEILLAIDSKYMIKGKWKLNEYNYKKSYKELDSKDYEGYVSIPNGEDLFSGNNGSRIYQNRPYPLANYIEGSNNTIWVVNTLNGFGFKVSSIQFDGLGARIKILLKNDVVISGGNGTTASPYTLK